MEKQG